MDAESQKLKGLYTCYICFNLLDDATAIKKCQHIFCWKCIYGKITQHGWKCCPVCYTKFGRDPTPLINLRHDDPLLISVETNSLLREQKDVRKSESTEEEETESEDEETDSDSDSDSGSDSDSEDDETDSEDDEIEYDDMETDYEDEETGSEDMETDSDDMDTESKDEETDETEDEDREF